MFGMLAGLEVDDYAGRVAPLAALCLGGSRTALYWMQLHWRQLPAMHAGMLLSTFLALPVCNLLGAHNGSNDRSLNLLRSSICISLMLIGMECGALVFQLLFGGALPLSAMIAGMALGMAAASLVTHSATVQGLLTS
jgi:hypothetical protein